MHWKADMRCFQVLIDQRTRAAAAQTIMVPALYEEPDATAASSKLAHLAAIALRVVPIQQSLELQTDYVGAILYLEQHDLEQHAEQHSPVQSTASPGGNVHQSQRNSHGCPHAGDPEPPARW